MPSQEEFEQAVADSRGQAQRWGLQLRTGVLWSQALRLGSPMVAALQGTVCHLAYASYSPRGSAQALFPDLPDEQRALWLRALVGHELVHCLLMRQRPPATPSGQPVGLASAAPVTVDDEVLADLGAAWLLLATAPQEGPALVGRLADARAQRAAADPGHDTAAVLHCLLAQHGQAGAPAAAPASPATAPDTLAWLQAWRRHCQAGILASGHAAPTPGAPHAAAVAWALAASAVGP